MTRLAVALIFRDRKAVAIAGILITLSVALRLPGLGASSLWQDDVWVAYAHKAAWHDLLDIGLSAPGFSVLLRGWFELVGFSELTAQLPAFGAGVAAPAVVLAVLRQRVGLIGAAVAAFVVVLSPMHIEQSTHVKQYTLEVIFGLMILHTGLALIDERDGRRWRVFAVWSTVGFLLSFPLAIVVASTGTAIFVVALQTGWRAARDVGLRLLPIATGGALWFFTVIRHRMYDNLRSFWKGSYLETEGGVRLLLESVIDRTFDMFEAFISVPSVLTALVVAFSFGVLTVRRPAYAVACGLPYVATLVLAGLQRAPLGGGRTDMYLLAPVVVGVALGCREIAAMVPRTRTTIAHTGAAVAAVAVLATAMLRLDVPPYPEQDIRPLIALLEDERSPDDVVLLYYASRFAYATYADVDVTVHAVESPYGLVFDDPRLVVQRNQRADPSQYLAYAREADQLGGRIWFLGSAFVGGEVAEIVRQIEEELGRPRSGRMRLGGADLIWFDEVRDV